MLYIVTPLATLCSVSKHAVQVQNQGVQLVAVDGRGEGIVQQFNEFGPDAIGAGFIEVDP